MHYIFDVTFQLLTFPLSLCLIPLFLKLAALRTESKGDAKQTSSCE